MKDKAQIFWAAARLFLGVVFVYASVYKIGTPGAFAHEIHNYRLLPGSLVNAVAIILPWLELFCGLALLANRWTEGASNLIAAMMVLFTAAVGSAAVRGLNVSCGCFKAGGESAGAWLVVRDVALTVLAGFYSRRTMKVSAWNSPT